VCHARLAISRLSQRKRWLQRQQLKSETVPATEAAKELIWLDQLFCDILKLQHRPVLQPDSNAAVKLVRNPEYHHCTKHINTKHFFESENVIVGV